MIKNLPLLIAFWLFSLMTLGSTVSVASATGTFAVAPVPAKSCTGTFLGLPAWYEYLEVNASCEVSFEVEKDIPKVLLAVFEIILRLGGVAAVVMVITGGVQYMISQGEPDKIKGARVTIINSIVGLVIAIMAVVIVNFVGGIV